MNLALTRSQHTMLSYAILVTALIPPLFFVVGTAVSQRVTFNVRLGELRSTYASSAVALANSDALRAHIGKRRADDDSARALYRADTAALGGAQLQNQLRALIEAEHGTLTSSSFRPPPADAAPLTALTVDLRLRTSIDSLVRILHGLEGREPILFVDRLVIQSRGRTASKTREIGDDLDIELEITGYLDAAAKP